MARAVETGIAAAPNVLWLADGDTGHGNAGGAAASVPAPQAVRDRDTLRCGVAIQLLVRGSYFDRGRALAVSPAARWWMATINLEFYRLNYQLTNEINFSSLTSGPDEEGRTAKEL
jgi:hypothetical protein